MFILRFNSNKCELKQKINKKKKTSLRVLFNKLLDEAWPEQLNGYQYKPISTDVINPSRHFMQPQTCSVGIDEMIKISFAKTYIPQFLFCFALFLHPLGLSL